MAVKPRGAFDALRTGINLDRRCSSAFRNHVQWVSRVPGLGLDNRARGCVATTPSKSKIGSLRDLHQLQATKTHMGLTDLNDDVLAPC